jgi:hypothetical protein
MIDIGVGGWRQLDKGSVHQEELLPLPNAPPHEWTQDSQTLDSYYNYKKYCISPDEASQLSFFLHNSQKNRGGV